MKDAPRTNAQTVSLPDAAHAVGHLAGELVHALRNPVSALMTSFDLLSTGVADPSDVPALQRVIRNELTKLNELLGRCRELTRLESLALAPGELTAVVRERLEAHAADLEAQRVALTLTLPNAPIPLPLDAALLGAALDALVQNALDAMPEGGELTVALAREGEPAQAVLTVRDTGRGIPPAALPNVFRLFYTTRKGAAGMGLPLARQVLLAHGGTVSLASEEGRGTTATVRLPLPPAP